MKLYVVGFMVLLLAAGCGKTDQDGDKQAGTATQAGYNEVIGSSNGYIIQDAKILIDKNENGVVNLNNALKLGNAKSYVMVLRGSTEGDAARTILALQFPTFAEGTISEFDGSADQAQFVIYGDVKGTPTVRETGLISGSLRCRSTQPSGIDLGLNRELLDGVGDMEILISNIQPGPFRFEGKKRYIARFNLPIVSLDEIARLTQPS